MPIPDQWPLQLIMTLKTDGAHLKLTVFHCIAVKRKRKTPQQKKITIGKSKQELLIPCSSDNSQVKIDYWHRFMPIRCLHLFSYC